MRTATAGSPVGDEVRVSQPEDEGDSRYLGPVVVQRQTRAFRTDSREGHGMVPATRGGRMLASRVSDAEVEELHREHGRLALQKVQGTITAAEQRRLKMLRWQLDRIEDAQFGAALDVVESLVEAHERLGRRIDANVEALGSVAAKRRKRGK